METIRIALVKFSDSFEHVWADLAHGLGAENDTLDDRDLRSVGRDVAALLLAAGGAEREALEWLDTHEAPPDLPVYVVGADRGRRIASLLVGAGAKDYLALPEDIEILHNEVAASIDQRRAALQRLSEHRHVAKDGAFAGMIGESRPLKEMLSRAARILPRGEATVLIVGETGTGKELLARAIHDGGPRAGAPFVAVNCSALPEHLIESELFGHERGAFTDAHAAKPGLFEVASGGTLFLDEIGELAPKLQAKFLRVLQDKDVRRVGGTKSLVVDVRIMAATNASLKDRIAEGTFREDLYFRLGVITLALPPLRQRGDDVLLIATALLGELAGHHGLPVPQLDAEARSVLMAYHWPGNVRELRNAVERALLLSPPGELAVSELQSQSEPSAQAVGGLPFPAPLDDVETAAARAMLELAGGNRSEAARRLRISRRRLRRLLAGDEMEPVTSNNEDDHE